MIRTHLVSATVVTENTQDALKAAELLQRVSMGLALEGITVRMDFTSYEVEEDDEEGVSNETPKGEDPNEA